MGFTVIFTVVVAFSLTCSISDGYHCYSHSYYNLVAIVRLLAYSLEEIDAKLAPQARLLFLQGAREGREFVRAMGQSSRISNIDDSSSSSKNNL